MVGVVLRLKQICSSTAEYTWWRVLLRVKERVREFRTLSKKETGKSIDEQSESSRVELMGKNLLVNRPS